MTTYTKSAVKGASIVFVVSIIAAFLGYLVRLVLARNLTLEEFGLFYSVFAFLGMIGIFKSFGFDRALAKFIPEFLHKKRKDYIKSSIIYVSVIQLITNTIIITLVYLLSNFLALHFFNSSQASIVLRLMAIAFFIDSFVLTLKFSFQGFKRMLYFSGIDLVRMLLLVAIIFIGFRLEFGLFSPVIAYIAAPIILFFLFGYLLINKVFPEFIKSQFVLDKNLLKKISKYSIFIMATSAGAIIIGYTDIVVLTFFSGLKEVALYSIALPTARILIYIPNAIGNVLLPLTSELWVKRKLVLLRIGMESVYKYSTIITIPLVFIMFSFADLIIKILFGEDYILATNAMKILSIGMLFLAIHRVNANFFSGIGKPQIITKIVYSAAIFNLIANLVLIPIWGIIGAAIATATSYFIGMLMGLTKIRKFIKISLPINLWIKTLISGIILVLIIWFSKRVISLNVWLETSIVLIISGIVYITLLFLLNVINIEELKDLYKRIFR
ncbi:MAG: flippase [Nanoarchaeota archaeon]|nr:flippase [Nanoarchaeota archaeon]